MKNLETVFVVTLLIISVLSTFFVGVGGAESIQSNPELQSNGEIEISNWTDLNDIRNDLTGDYVLVSDLNENTAGYETYASSNANGGSGWDPIGEMNDGFGGTLDGQGYIINDLFLNRPSSNYQALFGFSSGDINNVSFYAK